MSSNQFRKRIRTSLANAHLQKALDLNAERRVTRRINALETLPDWKERRQRAHAVRAEVIENLDSYLDQFTAKAQANGVIVHRAKDAAEAVKIVLKIAKDSPRRREGRQENQKETFAALGALRGEKVLVAKSKSMVTEEINLNHALEKENIRVVETDLGEFIVQLRGEKPSHIITPALHLRKQDVGEIFKEKLDVEYTEDIPALTNIARKVLREVFLTADVGITGANFAIAEEGAICLVTNEGNGRMVTTLPPIHIALIGMERIVRNLDDLALMLSLLPRSATGQKLSVYTQIVHSPLPNQQRHFIILDNGRSRLRNSPLKESLLCIRCGACMNACPIFREIGGHAYNSIYPGPIGSVISAGLFGSEFVPLAQASTLCGACKDACPVDIDLPKLLVRVRAGQSQVSSLKSSNPHGLTLFSSLTLRMYSRIARHPRLFALSQKFAALGAFLIAPFSQWIRLPAFTGWGYSKDLPRFANKSFRERFRKEDTPSHVTLSASEGSLLQQSETLRSPEALPQSDTSKIERFAKELTAVHGHVHHAENATQSIIQFLQSRNINHIHLEPNVLDEDALTKADIAFSREPDPAIRVGVTKAKCGVADTGSVLEADGEGKSLHASLLPEVHLVVLHTSQIYPSLEDAIHLVKNTKSAVFITGPSATGDIESAHTIGVHGPSDVHVFLVDD
ncbi:MAG TPA: LUD domain-containing protein [Anaerolineales bacterium]|nr:LUD domain-containing protein [Anaerolineales bacterium]HQX16660.1 LUD domain-containing protein [Anaerolineales bacterium]